MSYRLRLEVVSVQSAIRALDLLRRLDMAMLDMETTRTQSGFLVHLAYDAPDEAAARQVAVRMGQIVGVVACERVEAGPSGGRLFSAAAGPLPAPGCAPH